MEINVNVNVKLDASDRLVSLLEKLFINQQPQVPMSILNEAKTSLLEEAKEVNEIIDNVNKKIDLAPPMKLEMEPEEVSMLPEVTIYGIRLRIPFVAVDGRSENNKFRINWDAIKNVEETLKYIVSEIIKQKPDVRVNSYTSLQQNNLLFVYIKYGTISKRSLSWKEWINKNFPKAVKEYAEKDRLSSFEKPMSNTVKEPIKVAVETIVPTPPVTKEELNTAKKELYTQFPEIYGDDSKEKDDTVHIKFPVKEESPKRVVAATTVKNKLSKSERMAIPANVIAGIEFNGIPMMKHPNGTSDFNWSEIKDREAVLRRIIVTIADKSDLNLLSAKEMSEKGFGSAVGVFYDLKCEQVFPDTVYWPDLVRETLDKVTK